MKKKSMNMMMAIFCLFMFFIHVGPYKAHAATSASNAISAVLCNVVNFLISDVARGVAVVAIVVVGVGLFLGKFSWGVGIATAIGIGMIFGAPSIVVLLAGNIGRNGTTSLSADTICPP